jgi:hypothetical protein
LQRGASAGSPIQALALRGEAEKTFDDAKSEAAKIVAEAEAIFCRLRWVVVQRRLWFCLNAG